jgi:NAD dependent epimerase/dehydratase
MSLSRSKKILVTGADGFIGSHLVERLLSRELAVKAFVLYNSFNSSGWLDTSPCKKAKSLEIFAGDVRDSACIRKAMQDCDMVLHLAALVSIPYSYRAPHSYVDTNVGGTLHILEAARDLNVSKVIITSTSEVYGTAQRVPIDEEHPLQAQSPYAATKIAADQMALSFYRSYGTPVTILRPFNTFGPRQSLRAIIPTIITQIASGSEEVYLGAVEPTRDLNYIHDTVEAFVKVGGSDKCLGQVVNAGSGHEISIQDLVSTIAKLMRREVRIRTEEQRLRPASSEVERLLADSTKLHQLTGWQQSYSLEKGLAETIAWFNQPENLRYYTDIHRYHV